MTAPVPELRRRLADPMNNICTDINGRPFGMTVQPAVLAAVLDAAEALYSARTSQEWAAAQDRWRELTGETP